MINGWPTVPLESVVRFQEGPGILAKDFHAKGVPLVRLAGLGGHQVTLNKCDYLDPSLVATKWNHFRLKKGDILVSTSASFGRPAVVGEEAEGAVFYTGLIRFRSASRELDEGYLKTFLGSRAFMIQAEAQASGSVISHFGPSHLRRMEIPLPPMREQQNISHVHSAIDDKIDLNRRMNETLEAMARAIFKDWFVDIGPTRAKIEGRAPYLAPELWKLFPHRLDEQGKPDGWIDVTVSTIADRIGMGPFGSNIKVETFVESGVPVISGKHLRGTRLEDSEFNFVTEAHAEQLLSANVQRGDIIFTHAGNIGQVSIIPEASRYDRYVLSQRQFYLRCNSKVVSPLFVLYFFKSHEGQHRLLANASQVGVPSISRPTTNLKQLSLLLPPKTVLAAFDALIGPFHSRSGINDNESGTLQSIRALLLPKLMSGEIRVKDAEKIAVTAL
jgi:type I restriction enzyme S subunit